MSTLPTPVAGSKRVQAAGAAATLLGIIVLGLAVPGLAHADSQAAASSAACSDGGWTDTVTVTNSPDASDGAATITGTGTGLDGLVAAAGGGQQSVTLDEPLSVTSVTVTGTLSWPGGFTAPFTTTVAQPDGCAAPAAPAGGQQTDTTSAGSGDTTSAADTGAAVNAAADLPAPDVTTPADTDSVTLCHATDSDTNPYVVITVDAAGAFDGHYTQHQGVIWNDTLKKLKIQWGDIIPPFVYHGTTYSENWDSLGQAIAAAGCKIPGQPGPTETVTSTETATETVTEPGPTVTVTEPGTTVTVSGPTVTVTDPGTTVTVAGPVITTTEEVPVFGPTVTQTVTETVAVAGESSSRPAVTKTATVVNCPPGAQVQGGSLAYTGGNSSTMSLIGGALTAGGLVCLIMARRRRAPRAH